MKYHNIDVDIRDVQDVQLEILLEFDRICKKHNIQYQLFAGTLLGAVRHKGFIPWDDDIDVCLLRKDYERFLELSESELDSKYFLQYYKTDPKAILQFAKIRKNSTIFTNSVYQDTGMHNGIFIDLFPLDNVKPDTLIGKLQPKLFNLFYGISTSRLKKRALSAKTRCRRILRITIYYFLKIIPKIVTDKLTQSSLLLFSNKKTEYVNHLTNGATQNRLKKYIRKHDDFLKMDKMIFEGHEFPIPRNYHEVLIRNFGDYMKLPPVNERLPHHGIIEVDFNTKVKSD